MRLYIIQAKTFLVLAFLLYFLVTKGQQRPKIGLVLSGGGAKGMAHIGFIKKLEEAGIYPDIITGTSMGSIVGGLYAIGYTADEMATIATTTDWELVLSNNIPFPAVSMEEKPYADRFLIELPFEKGKPRLPRGLIQGQELTNLLSNLTRAVHNVEDFSQFPIPFSCVATDITTGEAVVLNQGSLSTALRASMAIPSVFTPVKIDGRLLVDGGLVRNFPVQEALDMGADIIIGVFVSSEFEEEDKLNSLVDILSQSAFVTSVFDSREQQKLVDLYVEPDLEGYGTYSFDKSAEIIKQGEQAGEQLMPVLIQLADSLKKLEPIMEPAQKSSFREPFLINAVEVTEDTTDKPFILSRMAFTASDSIQTMDIDKRVEALFGTGLFEQVNYNLIPGEQPHVYDIRVRPVYGPSSKLKLSLHYNDETRANINLNLTARNFIGKHSRLVTEVSLSQYPRFDINYLKYIGQRRDVAFQIGLDAEIYDIPLIEEEQTLSVFRSRYFEPFISFFRTHNTRFTYGIRSGVRLAKYKPEVEGILGIFENMHERHPYAEVFAAVNSLNRRYFPTHGSKAELRVGYVFANELDISLASVPDSTIENNPDFQVDPFLEIYGRIQSNFPLVSKLAFRGELILHSVGNKRIGLTNATGLGGFYPSFRYVIPMYGVKFFEFSTDNLAKLSGTLQWEFLPSFFLSGIYEIASSKYPFDWFVNNFDYERFGGNSYIMAGGLELAYSSLLGPVSINLGKSSTSSSWQFGFQIGFYY